MDTGGGAGGRCREVLGGSGGVVVGGIYSYVKLKQKNNVVVNTIGKEPNSPLDYEPSLKHHHPNMNTLSGESNGRELICKGYWRRSGWKRQRGTWGQDL